MARLNLKKRKSRRRRRRVYGGGPLTDNWAPPASNTMGRHRDAEMFLYNKQKYLEQRDAKKPSKLRFISYLDYKRNRDIIPESTMRAIQSLMDNPDPKYQQLGYERLEDELKYRDIMANPTEYLKAWKEGKHRESHWRGTLAKTVAGLAATAAAAYSLYNWGIPGLMNPLSGGIKNAFAKDTAQEDLKNQGGTAEDQKKLDETVKQTEKESTAEKAQQMGAEVFGETVIDGIKGNNGGTPGTSVPGTTPAGTNAPTSEAEAEIPYGPPGSNEVPETTNDILKDLRTQNKKSYSERAYDKVKNGTASWVGGDDEKNMTMIDETDDPYDWVDDQAFQPDKVDITAGNDVNDAEDYRKWLNSRHKLKRYNTFAIDKSRDSSISAINPKKQIVEVLDPRDNQVKHIPFKEYHEYAMATNKAYQEDYNRVKNLYFNETDDMGNEILYNPDETFMGITLKKGRENKSNKRKNPDRKFTMEIDNIDEDKNAIKKQHNESLKSAVVPYRDAKGKKVKSNITHDNMLRGNKNKEFRARRLKMYKAIERARLQDKVKNKMEELHKKNPSLVPADKIPTRYIMPKEEFEKLKKDMLEYDHSSHLRSSKRKQWLMSDEDREFLENWVDDVDDYYKSQKGSGYHHRKKSGGRLRVTRRGKKLLKKYRRHLKKRSRY